ncbi:hypothetical protein BD410DRAFT_711420 [Rickenella mellea]|uniref:T6SS Phospholipase effector Tle1-like catalytic domain-containing protein n=1 Tax=Rickenella mellea TaxID=50990 RepID=A0A4Y7QLX2_9AGAM|nr:hypothetical protein BD410DRAFT_711420 [Rickenella mellea]
MSNASPAQTQANVQHVHKRIIICCDGTWQDGLDATNKDAYTNILRIARAIDHCDDRNNMCIPQIVFYQSGIGSENNFYARYVEADKVQEAYAFIAQNYQEGDEIFLFGFSRGAYTARMVAMFIGEIGVLNKTDMDSFGEIFVAYQKRGKATDPKEIAQLNAILAPWNSHTSPGKARADSIDGNFTIRCIGVFDTVGSLGLPEELVKHSPTMKTIFGFPDRLLGEHIERAYHALAIDETRADFDCCKFEQTEGGRQKGQILSQCWFTGFHADIGGGWDDHDLADLTLTWMLSNVSDILSFNYDYLRSVPSPVALWGQQPPHNPITGIYKFSTQIHRQLPTTTNEITHETIHSSVVNQQAPSPNLEKSINGHPNLLVGLHSLEELIKSSWKVDHAPRDTSKSSIAGASTGTKEDGSGHNLLHDSLNKASALLGDGIAKVDTMLYGKSGTVSGGLAAVDSLLHRKTDMK